MAQAILFPPSTSCGVIKVKMETESTLRNDWKSHLASCSSMPSPPPGALTSWLFSPPALWVVSALTYCSLDFFPG